MLSSPPLSILFADIDNFEPRNELQGRAAGDAALRTIGAVLNSAIRVTELAPILRRGIRIPVVQHVCGGAMELAVRVSSTLRQAEHGPLTLNGKHRDRNT
ncbi:diguanylate cyclase domain-containing protein [Bryocella elongata]|uniref:diguanylate cyclase domain-containing protein n=1 Tax=Bryocella elongata TaxID=863522 RepID=UPI000CDE9FF4